MNATPQTRFKVLLIEDNPADADLIAEMIASETTTAAFEVTHAARLDAALERLRAEKFDVILTDYNLPDAAGLTVLTNLRATAADTPILVVTGASIELEMALEAVRHGAQDYLIKGQMDRHVVPRSLRYAIERRHMEDALARSEGRLRQIIESCKDAFIVMDATGLIVEWNLQAEKIFDWSRAEACGRRVSEVIIPPRMRDDHENGLKNFLTTGRGPVIDQTFEFPALHRDGREFPVEVSVSAILIGDQKIFSAFVRDVTERKRIEEEVRRHSLLLEAMLDNMADGVVIADTNGKFLLFNQAAERIVGLGATDATPAQWTERYGLFCPDTVTPYPSDQLPLARAIRGESSDNVELFIRRPDKPESAYVNVTGRPLRDGKGKVYGGMIVFHDISGRKQAEQALKEKHEELTHAYSELDKSRRQQLELKDQVLSHVSHELRTPLTAAYQFITILRDGLAGDLQPQQKEYVDIVLRNLKQLHTMISDLLEITRAESGKLTIVRQRFSLRDTVADLYRTLRSAAAEKGITLHEDLPGELPLVHADPVRIRQVLTNLLDNALKFTPSGGSITVRAGVFDQDPKFVCVSVTDTGRGIKPEDQQKIFGRLAQADATSEESRRGLGLGLYICREIVQRHDGKIWVESQPSRGATFFFTLPADMAGRAAKAT